MRAALFAFLRVVGSPVLRRSAGFAALAGRADFAGRAGIAVRVGLAGRAALRSAALCRNGNRFVVLRF